jgi:malonate-semialdehyde dehydrogenase (acetylating)/methylmalonate-semialdehyde dehydrogenase
MAQAETAVRTIKNYIGGGWVDAEANESLDVTNPASGETLAQLPMSSQADLERSRRRGKRSPHGARPRRLSARAPASG